MWNECIIIKIPTTYMDAFCIWWKIMKTNLNMRWETVMYEWFQNSTVDEFVQMKHGHQNHLRIIWIASKKVYFQTYKIVRWLKHGLYLYNNKKYQAGITTMQQFSTVQPPHKTGVLNYSVRLRENNARWLIRIESTVWISRTNGTRL